MDDELKRKIKTIMVEFPCPKGCRCRGRAPEDLCKARSFGIHSLLECLEDDAYNCTFAVAFGGSYFCKCPARLEIARLMEERAHGSVVEAVSM